MPNCGGCSGGGCAGGGCGACCSGDSIYLTQAECELLRTLGQLAFLPLTRRLDGETPVLLGGAEASGETILALARKGLVSLDYDMPLQNFDYSPYSGYPCRGSIALSARGQGVVELLEIQGVSAD